ncbi:hypothetical protein M3181_20450 [Mesobacillus maritimus]|uniref:hypothetical protein n=1 Tax=Mesobacillus maritimus TaxID=1643336 RepID=UPI00203B6948|nr:hypothetical protein [Mesobacillus maritimus]MCM3671334.1 hypothetical protein [Mesobacillus maritimus]
MNELVKQWYGLERRAGKTTYSEPALPYQDIISASKFELEIHELPPYEHVWTVDSIIGNLYSTSYAAKRFLGGKAPLFEKQLKEELLKIDDSGVFKEQITISIKLAIKN